MFCSSLYFYFLFLFSLFPLPQDPSPLSFHLLTQRPNFSDINAYSTFITSLRQKQLLPYFSALRELAQLYLIDCNPPSSSSSIANNNNSTTTTTSSIAKRFSAAAASSLSTTYPAFSPSSLSAPMRAANAKELATIIADNDRYGGIFRAEEVYEFAERRADWYTVKGDVERAMYGVGCCVM